MSVREPLVASYIVLDELGRPKPATGHDDTRLGFIITRGRPRYAMLRGRHFVVARGKAWECDTIAEAYGKRDELIAAEKAKRSP